ncbi:conserved hypothetical protein [Sporisorium reilianum SRZ2]|uniref:Uncharacterized protein n=1 Tax=Sporisorium reilianum (strain SRZ2) TaxID=999809 RepID=E6ZT29_SPORE|nr:conserved hypothetical protein [Sporisorium reilianum SRZ2]
MATLPQQAPGPGATAQALPSYLSYSAAATSTVAYTSMITQVVYDPQGAFGPYQTVSVVSGTTTEVQYSVVNVPLLYTGPFPAPDLGTLYTTPGQSLTMQTSAVSSPTQTASAAAGSATATATAAPSAAPTQPGPAAPTSSPSASPTESASAAPTDSSPAGTDSATAPASTQESSLTAESAPSTALPDSTAPNPAATQTASRTSTPPTDSSSLTSAPTATSPSSIASPTSTSPDSTSPTITATTDSSTSNPSATAAGLPSPNNFSTNGLSGGQIAGIVVGALFALLLLLLLLLCCLRRRRSKREQGAVLAAATGGGAGGRSQAGGGARGNYAALGAGAAAGAALGAGARRGSMGSDDWEQDPFTGGGSQSGFFVVGGRRLGPDRRASMASRRSRASATQPNYQSYSATANIPPSSTIHNRAKTGGFATLAAAAAGFMGAAFGREKKQHSGRVEIEEEQPLSDDDLTDGGMAERRGLMPFHDSPGGGYESGAEMTEASPGMVTGPAAAVVSGAAGYRRGDSQPGASGSPQRTQFMPGYGAVAAGSMSRATSSAFSGSGSSSHATGATGSSPASNRLGGNMSSSNSTGGFTTSTASGTSLPPPPRAPRGSPQSSAAASAAPAATYGNMEPSPSATSYASPANPRFSADTTDSAASGLGGGGFNPALLGGAALGELAALAAGHRDSDGSAYSRRRPVLAGSEVRGSHTSELSAEELGHLRSTDPQRYSRFISTGSTLLGPDYQPSPDPDAGGEGTAGAAAYPRARLATIRSVSELGEKSDADARVTQGSGQRTAPSQPFAVGAASGASDSLGASSGRSARVVSPLPVYEAHQLHAGETLPLYSAHDAPRRPSESNASGRFVTPPDSPRNAVGGAGSGTQRPSEEGHRYADDEGDFEQAAVSGQRDDEPGRRDGAQLAEAGVASAGILGGVAAGWRRLTMGQYAWVPGASPSRSQNAPSSHRDSSGDLDDLEGRISQDHPPRNVSEDSSRLIHPRSTSRVESGEAALAPGVRSQQASMYGASIGAHTSGSLPATHRSSKNASGSSGEPARNIEAASAAQRSHPSLSSQHSSARSRGGYAASHSASSRRTTSDNSALDSLSAVAQHSAQSTGSGSSRSGYRSRAGARRSGGAPSEVSLASGASTGAASYSPSGGLSRGNTTSTREAGGDASTGGASYHASRWSGEGSSLMSEDVASSRATGGSVVDKRKRPRSSSGDGLSRLDSLREVGEASDAFDGGVPGVPPLPSIGGHYPSASLGAAVSRSAARDQQPTDNDRGSYLQSQVLPQRSRIRSLQPGTSAPAPTALAPSLSTPSLGTTSRTDLDTADASQLSPGMPASASWRPSPRVASASQRAAEAQAALIRAQQQQGAGETGRSGAGPGGATLPRSLHAAPDASGSNRGASFSWAQKGDDLESSQPEERAEAEADTSNRSFDWPKLFRF